MEDEGFELVAVQILVLGGRRTLRISIDRPGGVAISHCTRMSRLLSPLLDVEEPISGTYDLEVSSPGMKRPIQRKADFARFRGYRAKIRLNRPLAMEDRRTRYSGLLDGLLGDELRLLSADGRQHMLPLDLVDRAWLDLSLEQYREICGMDENTFDPAVSMQEPGNAQ